MVSVTQISDLIPLIPLSYFKKSEYQLDISFTRCRSLWSLSSRNPNSEVLCRESLCTSVLVSASNYSGSVKVVFLSTRFSSSLISFKRPRVKAYQHLVGQCTKLLMTDAVWALSTWYRQMWSCCPISAPHWTAAGLFHQGRCLLARESPSKVYMVKCSFRSSIMSSLRIPERKFYYVQSLVYELKDCS